MGNQEETRPAVEGLANKRRARHQEALQSFVEKLTSVHQTLEEQLLSVSSTFTMRSEAYDAELRRLFAAMSDDDFALACYEEGVRANYRETSHPFPTNLASFLELLNRLKEDRKQSLAEFEQSLIDIEESRRSSVQFLLKETTESLTAIGSLLPEEIERKFVGITTSICLI